MNIIDISSWQVSIDLAAVFANNPLDGVVVKATQGTSYINPEFSKWASWLDKNDKPYGFYHYLDGVDANAEAEHFYSVVKPYINKGIPVADYEGEALAKGTVWLKRFLDRFRELSGVKPMVYCSLSVVQTQNFSALTDHPLWIAQYADMNTVNGFVDKPWQKGSVSPFNGYVMQQYTSCGRLKGYDGNLDFDKFLGSYAAWVEMARGEEPGKKPVDPYIVGQVLDGKYGTGIERISRLNADGYDGQAVQDKVNELYAIALSCKKYVEGNMDYINSIVKILKVL